MSLCLSEKYGRQSKTIFEVDSILGKHIEKLFASFEHHLELIKASSDIIILRWAFTCSKSTRKTLEKGVHFIQS